jgi:hypothetical protein
LHADGTIGCQPHGYALFLRLQFLYFTADWTWVSRLGVVINTDVFGCQAGEDATPWLPISGALPQLQPCGFLQLGTGMYFALGACSLGRRAQLITLVTQGLATPCETLS